MNQPSAVGSIDPRSLCPYISFLYLECTIDDVDLASQKLMSLIMQPKPNRQGGACIILKSGFNGDPALHASREDSWSNVKLDGVILRNESRPGWAAPDSGFVDVDHILRVVLQKERIFAIHSEPALRDSIARWLTREPKPPFVRVSSSILQGAFLRGEGKGLWLHGTHVRSTIRPDTKYITGRRVQDALSPLQDSSFAMAAARSSLPEDAARSALLGTVGTAPRKGTMWNRRSHDFVEFLTAGIEALELIEETIRNGTSLDRPFPILATESHDLSAVRGACDIIVLTPDELPTSSDISDDMIAAADILQQARFEVVGSSTSPDFKLEVGMNGSMGGVIQGTVRMDRDDAVFNFGYDPDSAPTNPGPVRMILNALKYSDLFAVYYDSGHVVSTNGIGSRNINPTPFNNWQFKNFSGFDICVEKPPGSPVDIHANIGVGPDVSIFSWVAGNFSSGWLICDDGPGEVADFVHIAHDSTLSLIHAKAAHSSSSVRGISASAYEVVAGQAAKNSRYLIDLDSLYETLMIPQKLTRAAWIDGDRVADRSEFLDMLQCLEATDEKRVLIVQPHVSEQIYTRARAADAGRSSLQVPEVSRLHSLETLLNTTRGAVVALGADLHVIGSKV